MKNKPLVIIPAAGWGIRVGSPPAKELLTHPQFPQYSFLEYTLTLCKRFELDPLVISRKDKSVLNEWLASHLPSNQYLIVATTSEWTDTVLQTHKLWRSKNIVLLPDTVWQPWDAINDLILALEQNSLALLLHQVIDPENWGMVSQDQIIEKPQNRALSFLGAWGLIAFTNQPAILEFWQKYHLSRQNQKAIDLPSQTWIGYLKEFKDLTRIKI